MPKYAPYSTPKTSQGRLFRTLNVFRNLPQSPDISCCQPNSIRRSRSGFPQITTLSCAPPSLNLQEVHVVQPLVWPGVRCATHFEPPSSTVSPSCRTRSTFAHGRPRPALSSSATSSLITSSLAPVSALVTPVASSMMYTVSVADQNDFRVAVFEAQRSDALLDCRDILFEIGVDRMLQKDVVAIR